MMIEAFERTAKLLRPPPRALNENPLRWLKPEQHVPAFRAQISRLTDDQLTAEVARYAHSFRTSLFIYGLDLAVLATSTAALRQFHAPVEAVWIPNLAIIAFSALRGMAREYEGMMLRDASKRRLQK